MITNELFTKQLNKVGTATATATATTAIFRRWAVSGMGLLSCIETLSCGATNDLAH